MDAWLEELKHKEITYNYSNSVKALQSIVNNAPINKFFQDDHLDSINQALQKLFLAFSHPKRFSPSSSSLKDLNITVNAGTGLAPAGLHPVVQDNHLELEWVIVRQGKQLICLIALLLYSPVLTTL